MNPTLSLALIAKNEEDVIGRCFASIKNLVDEIIFVDTGSTDKTVEIARQFTDKIYTFKWIDDFAAARNYSFSLCTSEWIIWLDADDVIKPGDCKKIKELDYSNKDIIICNYEYFHDEYDRSLCTVPRERIIRRSLNLKWEQPIHEYLPIFAHHRQYISDVSIHHYRKSGTAERNLKILERIVRKDVAGSIKNDVKSRNVFYLAKEYYDVFRYDDALPYFLKYVTMEGNFWEDTYRAYYMIAMIYRAKKEDDKFLDYMFKSIKIEERRAEPYYQLGSYYFDKRNWKKAIHWYKMCLNIVRPKELLSSFQPEYYTWLPCFQLSLCYNNIGDMKNAYEYNEKVLKYRPKDSRALNNKNILLPALSSDRYKKDGQGKKLNLGCGNKPVRGYVNVDVFSGENVDEIFNFDNIPYKANTISAIYSEHSLEHVSLEQTKAVLMEWKRVLKPGGELILKIPDLELCCKRYLEAPKKNNNYFNTKKWFKYTIYGIQKSQAGEPDEAQNHLAGYSKSEIKELLEEYGFIIQKIENYDGWGTPSIDIRVTKAASGLKIGWVCSLNYEAAQSRIRVLNIHNHLKENGYISEIINYPDAPDYDVIVIGKSFGENDLKQVKDLKEKGKIIYTDLCEDILEYSLVREILSLSDKVICCSHVLEQKVKPINQNTEVIEDAWEK